VTKRLQSVQNTADRIGNNFPGPLSLFRQPSLASGVAQNRFQEHNPVFTCMNCAYNGLKIFEVVLGCGHQLDPMPKVQTSDSEVLHYMDP